MNHECSPTLSHLESRKSAKSPDLGLLLVDLELEIHGGLVLRYAGGGCVLRVGSGLMVTVNIFFGGRDWCAEKGF